MKSLAAFLVLALIWASGLMAFAARVQQSTPQPDPPAAGLRAAPAWRAACDSQW